MFEIANFCENSKFRMKCVEKYDASAEGASKKFWICLLITATSYETWIFLKFPWLFMNFPVFQQNSKFPWLILKFPDFSLTLNIPDFFLTSGNPV